MKKFLSLVLVMLFVVTLFPTGNVEAESDSLTGKEVMEKVYGRKTGEDRKATMEMVLINRHGNERKREIRQFERDFGEVVKTIMFFISPADVRNTSFMNWSYDDGSSDEQWLYLPALGRVKRITGDDRSDNFMGSDFTYEDMSERGIEEDSHEILRTEILDEREYYVVESVPQDEDYMYSKTVTWIDKEDWIGRKKEFYDREGELLKVLENKDYEEIDGILTVLESEMHDVKEDHRTVMRLKDVEYNTGITEDRFTERMMKRGL
ncbi:MAG: outer membrane lipoprotein-sorting protein [Halanaerobiales bacterium]